MKKSTLIIASIILGSFATTYAADAKANFEEMCAKCHGSDGKGQTKMGKKLGIADLSDAKVQAGFTDEQAIAAMKDGVKDKSGKQSMKPVEGLTDADRAALVPYVRSLKI